MKPRTTGTLSIFAVLLTIASLPGSFGSTDFAQGNQSQQQQQTRQEEHKRQPYLMQVKSITASFGK